MAIEVENLVKIYGTQRAVDDVSFSIAKGEIVGLLGPNGAGKSTTMKILTCYLPQTSGKVTVNGFDVVKDPIEVKKHIGYLPESNPLYYDMFVSEYLHFAAGLKGVKENVKQKIDEVIERTGITPERKKKIGQLSKGYKQRVGLAQALLNDPRVLIMDEPTSGLDPNQISDIRNLISEIGRDRTIVLSTHILQEVEMICSRAIIINKGKKVADAPVQELKNKLQGSVLIVVELNKAVTPEQLKKITGVKNAALRSGFTYEITTQDPDKTKQEIFNFAVSQQLTILSLYQEEQKLEEVFHSLTRDKN